MRLRALDLFCGAGGASAGLHRAGFEVVGVDIEEQPRYPFRFVRGDALSPPVDVGAFDLVWASPPCQAFTAYKRRRRHVRPRRDCIAEVRELLAAAPLSVIENVPGAPLLSPITLCGSSFGLDVRRHRVFECSFFVLSPPCVHVNQTPRFPQATNRANKRKTVEVGVWRVPLEVQRQAMGVDWMQLHELTEAIPPAYSQHIGEYARLAIGAS